MTRAGPATRCEMMTMAIPAAEKMRPKKAPVSFRTISLVSAPLRVSKASSAGSRNQAASTSTPVQTMAPQTLKMMENCTGRSTMNARRACLRRLSPVS